MKTLQFMIISAFLLAGCSSANTGDNTGTTTTPGPTPSETEVTPYRTLADALKGDWKIVPKGESYSNEVSAVTLSFTEEGMRTKDDIRGIDFLSYVEFSDLYDTGNDQVTRMTVTPQEISGDLEYQDQTLGQPVEYQVLYTVLGNDEVLAIRELGNGTSYFSAAALVPDYQDPQYFWIFRREAEEPAADAINLHSGSTFYAFCWLRENDSVYLQEIGTTQTEENWYDEYVDVLSLIMDYENHSTAVRYPVAEEIQWRITPSTAYCKGSLSPMLARVTTDENGTVTVLDYMDYLGYGYYEAAESSMFKYEDLLPYDSPDIIFAYHPGDILTSTNDMVFADISHGDPAEEVVFFTKKNVRDFKILSLAFKGSDASGTPVFDITEEFTIDRFSPAHPVSATLSFIGSLPNNAICYTDTDGTVKYYSVSQSGMDGSFILSPMTEE